MSFQNFPRALLHIREGLYSKAVFKFNTFILMTYKLHYSPEENRVGLPETTLLYCTTLFLYKYQKGIALREI